MSIGEFPPPEGSHFAIIGKPNVGSLIGSAFAVNDAQAWREPANNDDVPASQTVDEARRMGLSPYYYTHPPTNAPSPATSSSSNSNPAHTPGSYQDVNSAPPTGMSFELPLRTEDLGRVPFHHGFSSPFINGVPQQQPQLSSHMQPQPQMYYPNPHQHEQLATATIPLSNSGIGGSTPQVASNGNGFGPAAYEMSLAEYSELLTAMSASAPPPPDANGPQMHPQALQQSMVAGGGNADTDVSMMFEDNMAEVWSSAPASLE